MLNTTYNSELSKIDPVRFEDVLSSIGKPLEQLSREALAEVLRQKEILAEREDRYAILYYQSQPHQELFHRSQKKGRLITGSNQSGKSVSACAEGCRTALGIHPFYPNKVPTKGRVVASDIQKGIGENIQPWYENFLPKSEIKNIKKYPGGQWSKVYLKNGSTIDFMSYEQESKMFEGWVGDWVQFDEPPPRGIYVACMRGLIRRKGRWWIAMTPLTEPWIYDEIYVKGGVGEDQPDVFTFDITNNRYLSPEEIKDFESHLTEDEKEARLHGRFKHLSGLIYKEMKPEVNCIKSFEIPKDWIRFCAMDFHPRLPCAILWVAIDEKGTAYAYDELWIDRTVKEISEAIQAKEPKGTEMKMRFIDPLSATPDRISGSSSQREFLRYNLRFRSATKDWILGKNAVCEYLKVGKDGKPGIYFFQDTVPRTITAMTHYQWDEYAGSREGEKETPKKKYAHFPDCLRYILVHKPQYVNKQIVNELNKRNDGYAPHSVTGYSYGGS